MVQILSRSKNNPALIGDPGVGKTAIVEGLAQRIINGDVPEGLKKKRLLDMSAGGGRKISSSRNASKRCSRRSPNRRARSSCSWTRCTRSSARAPRKAPWTRATCSSPMLARGELHMIGATLDEYRKHVEKSLERRFQPVLVEEPSVEDTISILRGLKERYEVHHGAHHRPGGDRRGDAQSPLHRTGICPIKPST